MFTMKLVFEILVPTLFFASSSLNFINFILFSSKSAEFKTSIVQIIKINSIVDSVCTLILSVSFLGLCTLWYNVYILYLASFASRVLNLYSSKLEIQIIIKRYVTLKRANDGITTRFYNTRSIRTNKRFIFLQISIILFCIFVYSPYLFLFEIKRIDSNKNNNVNLSYVNLNSTGFVVEINKIGKENSYLFIMFSIFQIVIHTFNFLIMFLYSILSILKMKEIVFKVSKPELSELSTSFCQTNHAVAPRILNSIKTKEENTNSMILFICLAFMTSEFSTLTGSVVGIYIRIYGSNRLINIILFIVLTIYTLSNSATFFIYKKFNKTFSRKFKKIFVITRPMR